MKTNTLWLVALFLLTFNLSYAQDEVFKVLVSKGANKIAAGNSENWDDLKIGKRLTASDKITLGDNGYLGLAHKNGKTLELKTPGVYEVKKLSLELARQNQTAGKKYVDFVVGEMTSKDEDMAKNRHKYMSVTGSVERSADEAAIKLLLPKKTSILNSSVNIYWQPVANATGYVVSVTNLSEEQVFSSEVEGNEAILDFSKIGGKKEKNFLITVSVKDNPKAVSDKVSIQKILDDKSLVKEVSDLKSDYSEETALNSLVMAAFYEQKNLLADAVSSYELAIRLEPEVEAYKIAYLDFLDRSILNK